MAKKRRYKILSATDDIMPVGYGPFGPIFDQFVGRPKDAIALLIKLKTGEVIGALYHISVGNIDLVWGVEGTEHSDGYGLAKLVRYHHEVLDNLQELLNNMHVVSRSDNRVNLESDTHKATVRLTWDNESKKWLLTAFEKKNSVPDNTTDTDETPKGKRNDTATPQNTVSADKDSHNSETSNEIARKCLENCGSAGTKHRRWSPRCFYFPFYIKPQLVFVWAKGQGSCFYFPFYIKPQL